MCAKMRKEGMNWMMRLFYELTTAVLFRCWEHINQRNPQNMSLSQLTGKFGIANNVMGISFQATAARYAEI